MCRQSSIDSHQVVPGVLRSYDLREIFDLEDGSKLDASPDLSKMGEENFQT